MMSSGTNELLGIGIYSVPEAARLSGVSSARIRRWVRGYSFRSSGSLRKSPPVFRPQLRPAEDGELALGFLDLIEVRFVNAFLTHGVSWPVIRRAESRASKLFGTHHPFATKRFKTDGRKIFATLRDESSTAADSALLDLADNQLAFNRLISPYLVGLEFEHDTAARWRPLGSKTRVVIDPQRSFGQPVTDPEGVPTAVVAAAYQAEGSEEVVAKTYRLDLRSVRDAVEFEQLPAA